MKAQPRAPFMALTADIDDDRLEQLAREKGVGTLDRPKEREQPAESTKSAAVSHEPLRGHAGGPTPRSRMKTVNLELPDYVWTELKITAVRQQTSLRHVVMAALQRAGVVIADIDLVEDGRRNR